MRERIAQIADKNHRSMNSEIIGRLEDSINSDDPKYTPEHPDQLSGEEMAIVMAARAMTKGKRKALLTIMSSDQ
ncbi:Arc-like DNA binding domain protein [compost metagenome]